jgi:hypothetical protein
MVISKGRDPGNLSGKLIDGILVRISDGGQRCAVDVSRRMGGIHAPHTSKTDDTNSYFCHKPSVNESVLQRARRQACDDCS